jgi:phosphoglycerol transferase MdoB-like AlkP superfamily enzyme
MNILLFFDLALYGPWGIRIDATPLNYINTPKEMFASVPTGELILATSIWFLLSITVCWTFHKIINLTTKDYSKGKLWHTPILLLTTASLVIIMRGGLQNTPINHSNVYFSDQMFANHAAINFAWNFANSVSSNSYKKENPYVKMTFDEANKIVDQHVKPLQNKNNFTPIDSILNTDKPNVIILIWESLTAKLVAPLGGEPDVTRNLNTLSKEGLLFTNCYANGDRSDKGIAAILSGYYPQPSKSIIKSPSKTKNLPSLNREMIKLGYNTSFYHGGDLSFGNMKTYLRSGGVNHFIDEDDFDQKDHNSKWGAHDHILLDRFIKDINKEQKKPFFKTLFTLSSHEPFEFPDTYKFGKSSETNKFRSSHAYTDKYIGKFIEDAKKQDWWDKTLIIIIADHGHQMPKHDGYFNSPKKFKIPMLWLGGALKKNKTTNDNICSQSDLAFSLLSLLKGDVTDFKWSKDIFSNSNNHFAHYIYNKGFGTINKDGVYTYDFLSEKAMINTNPKNEKLGKAITQTAYQDFLDR